ncbi:hypothetical protein FRACYDRAFT_244240 [Fragilariopsis cylindrus CCMP1102]|uniref:Uncharacterized protein n=1 Tax=Fragilariopsis cylindrus CCMP1102 TaxID=635003 RepID=A0A1E7F1S2_9STRA|nr:hypothetical protein FRACYDRAFT_244240 [Fragilariopsis cylindrus CCMP1102]|eukprot:OEU12056.1 hypothetical protein FRACYDRAFT_244240 [Fragilariopsis cylindrus CCMP1102]
MIIISFLRKLHHRNKRHRQLQQQQRIRQKLQKQQSAKTTATETKAVVEESNELSLELPLRVDEAAVAEFESSSSEVVRLKKGSAADIIPTNEHEMYYTLRCHSSTSSLVSTAEESILSTSNHSSGSGSTNKNKQRRRRQQQRRQPSRQSIEIQFSNTTESIKMKNQVEKVQLVTHNTRLT